MESQAEYPSASRQSRISRPVSDECRRLAQCSTDNERRALRAREGKSGTQAGRRRDAGTVPKLTPFVAGSRALRDAGTKE